MSKFSEMRDKPVQHMMDEIRQNGLEVTTNRYYGLYRGIVIENNNTEDANRGLVRIQVPALGHDIPDKVRADWWARPCMPGLSVGDGQMHGFYYPPDINDEIWVQFENGDVRYPVYTGGFLRVEYEGEDLIAENALYKGIRTKSGHYIRFSDDKDNDDLHITIARGDGDGGVSGATISLTDNGSVLVANDKNSSVYLDAENNSVSLIASDGEKMLSSVELKDDEVTAISKSGGSFSLNADVFTANVKDFVVNAGGKIALLSGKVFVGDSKMYEPAVRGMRLNIWALAHQHLTTLPGVPTTPFAPPPGLLLFNELSEIVSIG